MRTNLPIRIRFDRPVDRTSVTQRFSIRPETEGEFSWERADTLVFSHRTLETGTVYEVALEVGYRDRAGHANGFRHSWVFHTERAPELRTTSPNRGEHGVDPAAYVGLTFSREILPDSFRGALIFNPSLAYSVRGDPEDAHRLLVAPHNLLNPNTEYQVLVGREGTDVDGNHLVPARVKFHTGPLRPLARWLTYLVRDPSTQLGAGVGMVDEAGFPRLLDEEPADGFAWSPDGSGLLVRHPDGGWSDHGLAGDPASLPFIASWAANLGPGQGYAYLEADRLSRLLPDGSTVLIADHVAEAAVSRDLGRIAFSVEGSASKGGELRGYDVALRSQYRLQHETGSIAGISWAPNGGRIAYLLSPPGASADGTQLRVKLLTGAATASTVATGEISDPNWLTGSHDLAFSARVDRGSGRQWRIFRINPSLPPAPLLAKNSLAPSIDGDSTNPVPSPDGHQIGFLVNDGTTSQVWLMNADGTGTIDLTRFDAAEFPFTCTALHWAGS